MKGIWSSQVASGILIAIVIVIGIVIFAPKLFVVIKPILGLGDDDSVYDPISVNESFVKFAENFNKCGNFNGDCRCFKDISRMPSSYKIAFNDNKINLINKDKVIVNEINIKNKVSCVGVNKNGVMTKLPIDSSFTLDFSKASEIIVEYNQNNKQKKEGLIVFYKFVDNSLCLVTDKFKDVKLIESKPYCF